MLSTNNPVGADVCLSAAKMSKGPVAALGPPPTGAVYASRAVSPVAGRGAQVSGATAGRLRIGPTSATSRNTPPGRNSTTQSETLSFVLAEVDAWARKASRCPDGSTVVDGAITSAGNTASSSALLAVSASC